MDVSGTPCGPLAVMGDPFQRGGTGALDRGRPFGVLLRARGMRVLLQGFLCVVLKVGSVTIAPLTEHRNNPSGGGL
ncbi:hypothetical protein HPB47_009042 [Ixodes persulcatus]|uniref:Uncharacterized protein n=1 Tax=Ixodes persulcatus TaxID=34615 RepID=A0AC60P2Y4_IXOPE|nr:hypothetical protein HPB47_009042 [Ixodes persulcatus]